MSTIKQDIDFYNNFRQAAGLISDIDWNEIKSYTPSPTDSDYKIGHIKRYFVYNERKHKWQEVDISTYRSLVRNEIRRLEIYWRVNGELETTATLYDGKILIKKGVIEANKQQISKAQLEYSDFINILPNKKQFYKKNI